MGSNVIWCAFSLFTTSNVKFMYIATYTRSTSKSIALYYWLRCFPLKGVIISSTASLVPGMATSLNLLLKIQLLAGFYGFYIMGQWCRRQNWVKLENRQDFIKAVECHRFRYYYNNLWTLTYRKEIPKKFHYNKEILYFICENWWQLFERYPPFLCFRSESEGNSRPLNAVWVCFVCN